LSVPQSARCAVVEVASESGYGIDPGGGTQIPVYGELMPGIEAEVFAISRSQSGLGSPGMRQAFASRKVPTIRTYVMGSGVARTPPSWMTLLDGSAMRRVGGNVGDDRAVWRGSQAPHPSLTIRHFIGGRRYTSCGCRGGWSLEGTAGKPVPISFDFRAPYQASEVCVIPNDEVGLLDPLPALCDAGFVISPQGEAPITPRLLSTKITSDIGLASREVSRRSGGFVEFRPESSRTTWAVAIEDISSVDWDSWFLEEIPRRFNLTITVGTEVGKRVRFPMVFFS
jgi:hypothetical protein